MSEATKRIADAPATQKSPLSKKVKIDTSNPTKLETDYPPAVSTQQFDGARNQEKECDRKFPASAAAEPTVLTFVTAHHKFARLQLLSTHTIYDLVATLCRHTPVGYEGNEGPDDHLWHINYRGREYKSRSDYVCPPPLRASETQLGDLRLERGSLLTLMYDYGSTSTYQMTLLESRVANNRDDLTLFPRNQTSSGIPATYQKYQPQTNCSYNLLDAQFLYLNDWIFHKPASVSVNLFQAGRKRNYGFMDNKFTMMYLPTKPDNLANWLECFNRAACIKPAGVEEEGYAHYTWQSVVALPRSNLTQQLMKKYKSNERRGFCDAPIVEDHTSYPGPLTVDLQKLFPKIAALAGLRKDKRVPKGWISFSKHGDQCDLVICKGNAREPSKSKAPTGLAFEGENQHVSVEEPLFRVSSGIDISGLHDLFCVVEGLLRTL